MHRLFLQYGIKSMSMDDLAREMGISKKTIYTYVSNKTELVDRVLEYIAVDNQDKLEDVKARELNAIDQLFEYSIYVSNLLKDMNPATAFDMQKYYPEIERKHIEFRRGFILDAISDNFRKGKEEGLYREELSVELVARIYVVKIEEVLRSELLANGEFSFSTIFQTLFENHIRGIANEKGLAYFENKKKEYKF